MAAEKRWLRQRSLERQIRGEKGREDIGETVGRALKKTGVESEEQRSVELLGRVQDTEQRKGFPGMFINPLYLLSTFERSVICLGWMLKATYLFVRI